MPKFITIENRKTIVENKKKNKTSREIADFLNISTGAVDVIWGKYKNTGDITPKINNCGRKSVITLEQKRQIEKTIKETPDSTLQEIIDKLDLNITVSGLSYWLKKEGYSYKKKIHILPDKTLKK